MKRRKIDCGCEKGVFACRNHAHPQHTPGPLSFDGFGINLGDKYKSRLCTFLKPNTAQMETDNNHYGPLLAAAPDLLEALKWLLPAVNHPEWSDDEKLMRMDAARKAISKAEGKI